MKRRQRSRRLDPALSRSALLAVAVIIALAQSTPAAAQTSEAACVQHAEAIKTAVIRMFGGDNVNYGFFRRADRASELCRGGQIGKALDIVAALKSDLRAYRNELFEDR